MAFQIKDFASIAASMINWMRGGQTIISDFKVGSVARTMLEADAAEMDELYQQMFIGLREAIPVAIYRGFEFAALPATSATGTLRVTIAPISNPTVIAAGTIAEDTDSRRQFLVLAPVTIPANATTADLQVQAATPGASMNMPAGTAFRLSPSPLSFVAAEAYTHLAGGTDGESEEARKARFRAYIASLGKATPAALLYAARMATLTDTAGVITERVTRAAIEEEPGTVTLYVHGSQGLASTALVQRVQQAIDGYVDPATGERIPGYRAAGVRCFVYPMQAIQVPVSLTVTAAAAAQTTDLANAVRAAIDATIAATPSGSSLAPLSLLTAALNVPLVRGADLAAPTQLVACPANRVLTLGTYTMTWRTP